MTFYNLKEHCEATEIILQCILKTSTVKDIQSYKRAIKYYSDKLNEPWK